jgi:hypothetical protein
LGKATQAVTSRKVAGTEDNFQYDFLTLNYFVD